MKNLDDLVLYRFRVRTADGREAVSRVVATRRPLKARLASAPEQEVLEDGDQPGPMLANPRWSSDAFANGDQATLLVDGPGFEGRMVNFAVERRDGEGWAPLQTLTGKVVEGVAQATLQLEHAAPAEGGAEPEDLRFSCELA